MDISKLILLEDDNLLAINKPTGLLSQSDRQKDTNAWNLTEKYLKNRVHLLNRLDRPTSGLLLFSKNSKFTRYVQKLQKSGQLIKSYFAITENAEIKTSGMLRHYMIKSRQNKAICFDEEVRDSKAVSLSYKEIHQFDNYRLLQIELFSGRFHQIRAQLSKIGCPIKGDIKYGAKRGNKDRSIYLHAYSIQFLYPDTNRIKTIRAAFPLNDTLWQLANETITSIE